MEDLSCFIDPKGTCHATTHGNHHALLEELQLKGLLDQSTSLGGLVAETQDNGWIRISCGTGKKSNQALIIYEPKNITQEAKTALIAFISRFEQTLSKAEIKHPAYKFADQEGEYTSATSAIEFVNKATARYTQRTTANSSQHSR